MTISRSIKKTAGVEMTTPKTGVVFAENSPANEDENSNSRFVSL